MINLISQGKIIRQFWDKIIRHSTRHSTERSWIKMQRNKVNMLLNI